MSKAKVSILARPEGRALRVGNGTPRRQQWFQSSPAPRGGRYNAARAVIRAISGFNPRPPRVRGRYVTKSVLCVSLILFQSSPAPRGGRYIGNGDVEVSDMGFNPRPPRGAGATKKKIPRAIPTKGFNPRPPRGAGATKFPLCSLLVEMGFNPRPPRGAGATCQPW